MRSLVFATNNRHKIEEMQASLGGQFSIVTLADAGIAVEIPEPYDTLEENAKEKARVIHRMTGLDCFSEDTGLEVAALDGEPGVRSARYAGEPSSSDANIEKLLYRMEGMEHRAARFRTVICLIRMDQMHYFEGICEGTISTETSGTGGFGYDRVFVPTGNARSFGEMDIAEKNRFSHRRKALDLLVNFLNHHS